MVSEAASTANRHTRADEAPQGSLAARGTNRPPHGRGRQHVNRNVRGNASNVGNPARSGPSQGGNAGNVGDNGDAIDRINQLAAAVTQMAMMLTQINGMPIPPEDIRVAPMPPCLKLPDLKYDGTGDPAEHLETYKSWMELNSASNAFQCRAFVITLTGMARRWFRTLRPSSIFSFCQLSESFISQFVVNKVQKKPARHLYTIRQKENESTEAFLNRFVKEEMGVKDRNDSTACGALLAGLRRKRKIDSQAGPSKSEGNGSGKRNNIGNGNNNRNQAPQNNQVPQFREYTTTTVPVATIYAENEHLGIFTIPPNIKTSANKRDNTKYCRYHRDIGHITEECRVLKDEIERLIQRGQLRNYVRGNDQQPRQPAQENQQPRQEGEDIEVRVIIGGPATGDTNRARKNYARQARSEPFPHQVNLAKHKNKAPRLSNEPIIFTEEEASGLWHPHKDAIVVALKIASRKVYKILIDNGSSADIFFRSTLNSMNLV
ncbi:hypothetical protein UlMin_011683 [Ulmus minor]